MGGRAARAHGRPERHVRAPLLIVVTRAPGIGPALPSALAPRFAGARDAGSVSARDADGQGEGGGSTTSSPSGVRTLTPVSSSIESTA